MRFEELKTVLDHARHFHRMIADFYHNQCSQTEQIRMKMLLEYLEHHERTIEQHLADYEKDAPQKVLRSWTQYSPCEAKLKELKNMLNSPATDVDEVIRRAILMDECLIEMYRELSRQTENMDVRAILDNLLELEESELRIVARDSLRMYEM